MPKPNDRIGSYQLIRKLGEGGFGEVWLALDSSGSGSHEVAVKMPLKSEIDFDALLQEATLWARATGHPNVLEFLAARVFDGQIVLVSEFAPDGSLKDWLKRNGGRAPSVEAAVQMTQGILAGLEHLHGRNIIHRDVKPDNVLLQNATPRLADFGISRVLKTTSHTVQGAGTPTYMAPEAFKRKRNQQTDLWSVAVMLYQMLSGRLPFDGADITELYGAILNEEPDPLPAENPEWLRQVVAKALTKDPEQRFKTSAEMRAALTPQPPTIKEVPAPPPVRRTLTAEPPTLKFDPVVEPPKPKPTVVNPLPKPPPTQPTGVRPAIKWGGAGLAAIVLAVVAYVATKTTTVIPPSTFDSPGSTQPLPNPGEEFAENLNGVSLQMKRVPGGELLMGSPENEPGRYGDEGPQHPVKVSPFSIGKYEVTQAQWKAVMGDDNPSSFKGDEQPVENVSWDNIKEFLNKSGNRFRLPTEAEWEYAARAGSTASYSFGNDAAQLGDFAWFRQNSGNQTHPVGQKKPNRFGLFDMHGNVWEWCSDWYGKDYYAECQRQGVMTDPPGTGTGSYRVVRGGSWGNYAVSCRTADRYSAAPDYRYGNLGFRLVRIGR